jgi:hypothetical protein
MMKALMGKMNKLSTKMISRHDVLSLKGNEIKRFIDKHFLIQMKVWLKT